MCAMSVTMTAPMRRAARMREVDDAGIRARADHDHLRLVLVGQPVELVVIDPFVVRLHAVGDDFIQQARKVERVTVRQVAAVGEVHAEDGVARLHDREIHGHVGLRARMRLHIRVLRAEELFRPADGEALDDVHVLAAAVVPATGVAFGVLIGEHGARRGEDGAADEVFRGDQLETVPLPVQFVAHRIRDFRIGFGQSPHVHMFWNYLDDIRSASRI